MTKDEVQQVLRILRLNYPHSFKDFTKEQSIEYLNLWAEAFKNDNVNLVVGAVKSIIYSDTREFAPNIGQVKAMMIKLSSEPQMSEYEVWNLIKKAVSNGIYGSAEEFRKLPDGVKRLVGSPEQLRTWAMMDIDELNTVVASNIQRSYRAISKQEQEYKALPLEVKEAFRIGHRTEDNIYMLGETHE